MDFMDTPEALVQTPEQAEEMRQAYRQYMQQQEDIDAGRSSLTEPDEELLRPYQVSAQQMLQRLEAGEDEMGEECGWLELPVACVTAGPALHAARPACCWLETELGRVCKLAVACVTAGPALHPAGPACCWLETELGRACVASWCC
jgi:hypothetical protein